MADVTHVADRVLEQLSAPFHVDCHRLQITCSIGISIFPEHGLDIEALVKNADAAMYASKESGRSTYRFFDHAMGSRAARRLTIENLLRSALETDEFHLEFQPELDLRTGKIACFEALLRWNNPTLGVIPPDQFIPIAEETGIIVPLGAWVLRTACAEARRWLNQGFTIPVAVNVSAVQIRHEGFVEMVAACLEQSKLPAPLLEIELTESALLSRNQSAFDSLRRLRDLGVTLAMDDFGTGYSGLSYLKAFPMDKVKIDRSFVRDLNRNAEDAGLIAAVVAVAGARGMIVTAEGVETEEQLTLLRTLECGQAQGFHLSRPIYPSQIRDCLSQFQERFRNLNAPELICHSDLP
jgi:predicted signal transduction protein with EAL and GGDEF domain